MFERNPTCFTERAMKHLSNTVELAVILAPETKVAKIPETKVDVAEDLKGANC